VMLLHFYPLIIYSWWQTVAVERAYPTHDVR
jgi:hypothetical protein